MARTKQTARKSTYGKAPRKQLASRRPPRSPTPETLNIAHPNQYALLREESPVDGSGSEATEELSEALKLSLPPARKAAHRYCQESQSETDSEDQEIDEDQEARAGQQQQDEESQNSQPAADDDDDDAAEEDELSNISKLTDNNQDNHATRQEAGAASIQKLNDASKQPSGRRNDTGNHHSRSKMKQMIAAFADGPSGKTYSQAIPIHGTQLVHREGDLNVMSDPDLSQERLKRTRSYEDDDDEEFERTQDETPSQIEVSPAQSSSSTSRKKHKRSASVPAIESPGNIVRNPDATRLPPIVKMASADDKTDEVTEKDAFPSKFIEQHASAEDAEAAARQAPKSAEPQQSSTAALNAEQRKTSSFIDFEALPGPPIVPFDTQRLSSDYETLADEHDVKMKGEQRSSHLQEGRLCHSLNGTSLQCIVGIMEEWQKLNEKIETWILRGTQVQAVREGCVLLHNVQQVNEKVQEASKASFSLTLHPVFT